MLKTPLCELVGIGVPIIQAGMGPFTSAELAAAVSNACGLGSIGAATRSPEALERELERLRALTDRPFAVNHTISNLDENAFQVTLRTRPSIRFRSLPPAGSQTAADSPPPCALAHKGSISALDSLPPLKVPSIRGGSVRSSLPTRRMQ